MKKAVFVFAILSFMIIYLQSASALAEFYQFKLFTNNETALEHKFVQNHISFFYTTSDNALIQAPTPSPPLNWWFLIFPFVPITPPVNTTVNQWDYVKSGRQYEAEIRYTIYPKTWNELNSANPVLFCNFSIRVYPSHSNDPKDVFSLTINQNDSDVRDASYFVRLSDGDFVSSDIICKYAFNTTIIDIPADFSVNTPTWECKACQYHNWLVQEQQISQAKTLGDNTVTVFGFIKSLFGINFELIVYAFWIFLIFMVFFSIELIFVGLYYIYNLMKKYSK